ncbi:MAG: putative peptidase BlaR1 [Clostridia bacterium]|jgi:beta-lactamase regulating signal transducer with metallopeptidase domain|nr:putative peptidase BlaR1 [Clostridia bacterium]
MIYLFNKVIDMSITASLAAMVIIIIRIFVGDKMPRIFSYFLWSIVLFRVLIPISFSSNVSVFNFYPVSSAQPILSFVDETKLQSGCIAVDHLNQISAKQVTENIGPDNLAFIWLCVAAVLMVFCIAMYSITIKHFKEATLFNDVPLIDGKLGQIMSKRKIKVYTLETLSTPVVVGVLKPRIIVPANLINADKRPILKNIISHEIVHIMRFDHLIKLTATLAACVHWFNPILWIALILAHKDRERACDEKVIQVSTRDIRKEYAKVLLNFSLEKSNLSHIALAAFGESDIKRRIKGILAYKKPKTWIKCIGVGLAICIGVLLISDASEKTGEIDLKKIQEISGEKWTPLGDISPYVIEAAIASEDRNFAKHNGVDWSRLAGALVNNIIDGHPIQGGSTITQQVVKNLELANEPVSLSRKQKEMYTAIKMEKDYSKDEIMEAYLNIIFFGNGAVGIGDASKIYFHKEPKDLSLEEAASLMAIVQYPLRYDLITNKENNKQKADYIISVMSQ